MLGQKLRDAIASEFFKWFHLTRYEPPQRLADGLMWHGFRPEGPKFRPLVTFNLECDAKDRIVDATLCLDRAFIEHGADGAFARDLTASFLRWVFPEDERAELADFLAELGNMGPKVIRLASARLPELPSQQTEAYRVYLGRDKTCEFVLPAKILRLNNLQARDAPRDPAQDWLWLRAYLKEPGSP